ncbi:MULTISPECIES: LysE family translocator [Burkholderia]|jgi:threonine/homoserine/homoserine lactone efflux protein|uniref:LysE family transporter n=1 Tax=Burkholderia cenocepacia TaxID=95486 RepID=A0A9Q5MTX0_9BURK|nr:MULTISPECIES: LysE family transporter [Burkholderia]MDP9546196.1 threonine/homoserine/homoserine lactone efflux protein [Burkholderia cepacia]ALV58167.1 lysine transporter LysE [Burkholderia cenocepacia]AMU08570.1 lysine transporter LysE [Burkholderia cenocepacia]AMU12756.1 lysine transporter LysE [Burkholderia cenocepacia]AOK39142.1 lysine transporter LysE [Burkholderia cenocepacia]
MNDFLFGLMIALSVGPVALMIANYGMRAGTATGVRAAIGVAAADGCYAVVAFTIGALLAGTLASHLSLFRLVGACVLLAMGARMLWQALRDRRRTLDGDVPPPPGNRPFMSMFFVTLANPLTILLFYGYATAAAGAHRHWLLGAACVFAGSLAGQLVFAFGGSAIGRFVKSPAWLAASHGVAALVVLGYGVAGLMRV